MLSTELKSDRAIIVNLRIMRAFVQLREMLDKAKTAIRASLHQSLLRLC